MVERVEASPKISLGRRISARLGLNPLISIRREETGEAQYRTQLQGTRRISHEVRSGDRYVIIEHVSRKTRLKIGPLELPLPPKRQMLRTSEPVRH